MTKHIVGLILFSLIVGVSAFVAGLFAASTSDTTFTALERFENYAVDRKKRKKRRCGRHRHPHFRSYKFDSPSVTLLSAELDPGSEQFSTVASFGDVPEEFNLDLHFYVKDDYGVRFIRTETLDASSWTSNYEDTFGWLSRFPERENIFVIPEVRTLDDDFTNAPGFDVDKATQVKITVAKEAMSYGYVD